MLKNCPDCQKQYSLRAAQCVHCGAPNDDLNTSSTATSEDGGINWAWIGILCVFAFLMFFYGKETRDYVLNLFDAGVVAEIDLKDCDNDRVKNQIKDTFDESPSALNLNLKAIMVESYNIETAHDAILSCAANISLNNNEMVTYHFNFKKQGNNFLVEGWPR